MTVNSLEQQAVAVLTKYVLAAVATGAIPAPATSIALVAENTAMVAHIGSVYGCEISVATLVSSFGLLGSANLFGRAVFVEVARWAGWGAAFVGAPAVVSIAGAATAGLQTYLIGLLAIEMAKQGGAKLSAAEVGAVLGLGRQNFDAFLMSAKSGRPGALGGRAAGPSAS